MDESFWHGVFWNHLVYPELSSDDIDDPTRTVAKVHKEALDGRFPDFVVCLCLDDYHRLAQDDRLHALETVRKAVTDSLPHGQCRLLGFAHTNSLYWCGESSIDDRPKLVARLDALRESINRSESLSVTIGISYLPEPSMKAWRTTAQLAVVAQRSKVRLGGNRVFVYDEATMSPTPFTATYWRLGDTVCRLVRSGDLTRVREVMDEISHSLFTAAYLGLIHLRPILQSLVVLMAQGAAEVGVDSSQVSSESERYLSEIATTYDYVRLKELIEQAAEDFTSDVRSCFATSANSIASAAETHIKEHIHDPDLGLHRISQALGMSSAYLCRAFKKAKGVGIVEYVNGLRVDEARRRLLDPNTPITDIAFGLGFGSLQHFGRVFRAAEGCSPTQYRSINVQRK